MKNGEREQVHQSEQDDDRAANHYPVVEVFNQCEI
jgi:hypothetical protein